ncbi:MAG: hybrid sensor histidine kinase/response regulator [Nitrospinota bacterium]|nr:hybrid sensor histidine kinase/response regulator [Nitrospinota bacterium]
MNEKEGVRTTALVIDDDPEMVLILGHSLLTHGFEVLTAGSAEEALSAVAEAPIDMIILDLILPGMSGIDFLKRLKSNPAWRSIPVIIATARESAEDVELGLAEGAEDYIRKPFSNIELLARINATLREKKLRNRLENSNSELLRLCQMKDEFLSMVSHDIRTPLNSIVGFADFLLEAKMGDLNEKQARMVDVIKKSAKAQLSLVENLLEVARLNSGRVVLRLRPADLAGIAQECYDGTAPTARKKNIDFIFTARDGIVPVMVDDQRICQVANNLISNALKFTPRGGRVEVDVFREPKGGVLCIRDTGPGIPEEERMKLFSRFEQTRIKATAGESGFGLGLAIVKNIVDMHNGRVWVESRSGEGSEFFVQLPLKEIVSPN